MEETLKDVFNAVYLRVYGDEYNFGNRRVDKTIKDFLKIVPRSIGEDWLYDYTMFQFAYYSTLKMRFNRVYLNWIYGEKAFQRWIKRTESQTFYADKYKLRIQLISCFRN